MTLGGYNSFNKNYMKEIARNVRIEKLVEREKELNCLYNIDSLLRKNNSSIDSLLDELVLIIPSGWQYTTVCKVQISINDKVVQSENYSETEWMQYADIVVSDNIVGKISVSYIQLIRMLRGSQFLPEEQKLLNTIAQRLGDYFFYKDLEKTVNYLKEKDFSADQSNKFLDTISIESNEHWTWRMGISKKIANVMDFDKFSVKGVYICGSTKNATAGPASDIDLIIHFDGTEEQKLRLADWIEGWSLALNEYNYLKTGYVVSDGLIDLHIVTDENIAMKDSFATMIDSVYNSAKPLRIRDN